MKFGPKSRRSSNRGVASALVWAISALIASAARAESTAPASPPTPAAPNATPKTKPKTRAKPAPKASSKSASKASASPRSKAAHGRKSAAGERVKGKRKSKRAFHRRHESSPPLGPADSPAIRYGALESGECLRELRERGIAFREEPPTRGVSIPVRLLGPLAGVSYRTDLSDRERRNTPWEIYDCRLVLSLADFSEILAKHDVREVRIFSAYRPPPQNGADQGSKRHQAALAVDVRTMKKESGEELVVLHDFDQNPGLDPCSEAREPSDPAAKELRAITCETARAHLFNSILTPNFDERHRNHFHLEVAPGKPWFLLR